MAGHLMAAFYNDREDEACATDDIVTRMRRVIDQLPAPKRELMMLDALPGGATSQIASNLLVATTKRRAVTVEQAAARVVAEIIIELKRHGVHGVSTLHAMVIHKLQRDR